MGIGIGWTRLSAREEDCLGSEGAVGELSWGLEGNDG